MEDTAKDSRHDGADRNREQNVGMQQQIGELLKASYI